jgi:hypothetical protein
MGGHDGNIRSASSLIDAAIPIGKNRLCQRGADQLVRKPLGQYQRQAD